MSQNMSILLKKAYPVFIALSVFLLICISISSSYLTFQKTSKDVAETNVEEMVTAWEKRQRKIRLLLPDNGVIGYLADWDIPEYESGAKDQEVEFILAQYTVAPLVLERGTNHELILGNFSDDGDPLKLQHIQDVFGIRLIHKYSNELFIFKGKGQ